MKLKLLLALLLGLSLGLPPAGLSQTVSCPGMAGPCGGQGPGAKVAAGLGVKLDHLEAQVRALDHLEVGVAPLQKGERWMAFLLRRTVALEQRVLELEKAKAPEAQTPVPVRGPLKLRLEQLELRIKALTP